MRLNKLLKNLTFSGQHSVLFTPFTMPKKVNIKPKSSWATLRQDQSILLHLRQGNRREAKQKQTATMHTSCIWILLITEYINVYTTALCWEDILFITHVKSQVSHKENLNQVESSHTVHHLSHGSTHLRKTCQLMCDWYKVHIYGKVCAAIYIWLGIWKGL